MSKISEKDLPFKLPLRIAITNTLTCRILDWDGLLLFRVPSREIANFICLACNSYFGQKKALAMAYEAICTGDQEALDKAIGLIEDLDKVALKGDTNEQSD